MITKKVSVQGVGRVNEDTCGNSTNRFWVLDGATPVGDKAHYGGLSDAQYIVNAYNAKLQQLGDEPLSNVDLLLKCSKQIRAENTFPDNVPHHEQPSFALAMVNIHSAEIEITLLSDCYVLLYTKSGVLNVLTDERVEVAAQRTRGLKEQLTAANLPLAEAKEILRKQIRANKELINIDGGYYVGTLDGQGFPHAKNIRLPAEGVTRILLCTDGFFKAFKLNVVTYDSFANGEPELNDVVTKLRKAEESIGPGLEKTSDDSTAMLISLV